MLKIRAFNASDGKTWYDWYHAPALARYFRGYINGVTLEQCCSAPILMRAHILMGFDENDTPVGAITLADTDKVLRIFKLGLLVDEKNHFKGYGKELMDYGVKWAFKTMAAHKIFAEILSDDTRIIRGCELSGFQYEGTSRKSIFFDGQFHDEVIYSILGSEYGR